MSHGTFRFFKIWHLILASLLLAAPVSLSAPQKTKASKVSAKGTKKSVKNATGKATKGAAKSMTKASTKTKTSKAANGKASAGKGPKATNSKADVAKKTPKKVTKPAAVATEVMTPASPDADLDASFGEDDATTSSGPWLVVFVLFVIACVIVFLRKHRAGTHTSRENFHHTSTHEGAFSTNMKSLDLEKSGHQTNPPAGFGAKLKGFFGNKGPGSQAPSAFGNEEDITEVSGFGHSASASSLTKTKPPKSRAG